MNKRIKKAFQESRLLVKTDDLKHCREGFILPLSGLSSNRITANMVLLGACCLGYNAGAWWFLEFDTRRQS
jgi:hypothetical protein